MLVEWNGVSRTVYVCGLESNLLNMCAYKHEEAEKRKRKFVYCECEGQKPVIYAHTLSKAGEPDTPICLICKREGGWHRHAHYSTPEIYCNCLNKGG